MNFFWIFKINFKNIFFWVLSKLTYDLKHVLDDWKNWNVFNSKGKCFFFLLFLGLTSYNTIPSREKMLLLLLCTLIDQQTWEWKAPLISRVRSYSVYSYLFLDLFSQLFFHPSFRLPNSVHWTNLITLTGNRYLCRS